MVGHLIPFSTFINIKIRDFPPSIMPGFILQFCVRCFADANIYFSTVLIWIKTEFSYLTVGYLLTDLGLLDMPNL